MRWEGGSALGPIGVSVGRYFPPPSLPIKLIYDVIPRDYDVACFAKPTNKITRFLSLIPQKKNVFGSKSKDQQRNGEWRKM